jgi:hypothetical protein
MSLTHDELPAAGEQRQPNNLSRTTLIRVFAPNRADHFDTPDPGTPKIARKQTELRLRHGGNQILNKRIVRAGASSHLRK